MIRPEKHTFKFSPRTKSKEDLELIKDLEHLIKGLELTKTQLTRQALDDFVTKHYFILQKLKKTLYNPDTRE